MIRLPAVTLVGPVILPTHGVGAALTVMEWLSLVLPPLVHVTDMDTERLPVVTPVIEIEDDVLLPLNPVPTVQS